MTIATLIITILTLFLVLCLVIGALIALVAVRGSLRKMEQRKAVAASITPEMREKLTKMFSGLGGGETK